MSTQKSSFDGSSSFPINEITKISISSHIKAKFVEYYEKGLYKTVQLSHPVFVLYPSVLSYSDLAASGYPTYWNDQDQDI